MSVYGFVPQDNGLSLYVQLKQAIISDITSGVFENMQKLPSRRKLAERLGLSTTTVNNAYQALVDDGYLMTIDRSGFYVKSGGEHIDDYDDIAWEGSQNYTYNFSYNNCDVSNISTADIKTLERTLVNYTPEYLFGHGNKRGESEFRIALSRYLSEYRQIKCGIGDLFVSPGVQYLLTVITMILGPNKVYGFENPTDYKLYVWMKNLGLDLRLVNISDKAELTGDMLDECGIDVMLVMPENQLPTGHRMSAKQRRELARWCSGKTSDKYIIEFTTDGNLVYDGKREKSIYSYAGAKNVIYIDSFEQVISSNTKAAFMVLPKGLIDMVIKRLEAYSPLITITEQLMYSSMINGGMLARLIRRNNKTMLNKRDRLTECLLSSGIGYRIKISNNEAGMNFLASFESSLSGFELSRLALGEGVKVFDLSKFLLRPNSLLPRNMFVFGWAGIKPGEIEPAVECIERAWKDTP